MKLLFQFWLIPIFLLNFLDVAKMEVATTMKIVKITRAAATTIIIRMAEAKEAAEDTTIKVIITNSKAASKDILVSIVDLLVMEIWEVEDVVAIEAGAAEGNELVTETNKSKK